MRRSLATATLALLLALPASFAGQSTPTVKLAVAPRYPPLTLAGRVYGNVSISVTIDRTGAVKDSRVLEGHPMLRDAALIAARQWQFSKSLLFNRSATLQFRFVLLPDDSESESQTIFLPPTGFEIREKPEPAFLDDEPPAPIPTLQPISVT